MASVLWSWFHGLWSAAHGLWFVISNVWSVAGGLWSLGYCPCSVDYALWSVVYCLCFLAYWPWPMAPGPWFLAVDHIPHGLCFATRNLLIAADHAWSMVHYALRVIHGLRAMAYCPRSTVNVMYALCPMGAVPWYVVRGTLPSGLWVLLHGLRCLVCGLRPICCDL